MEPKILLVDDDSSVRTLYKATLESQGYQVATAEDGEKALVHIKKELPDLILLDIMMPKVHGLNILDIIKSTSKGKGIKVIMLTALSDEQLKSQAFASGASDFIVKSEVGMAEVLKRIDKVLSR